VIMMKWELQRSRGQQASKCHGRADVLCSKMACTDNVGYNQGCKEAVKGCVEALGMRVTLACSQVQHICKQSM
jgi:hypothetical protein